MDKLKLEIEKLQKEKGELLSRLSRLDVELNYLEMQQELQQVKKERDELKDALKVGGTMVKPAEVKDKKPRRRKHKAKQTTHTSAERRALADENNPYYKRCYLRGLNLPPEEMAKGKKFCKSCWSLIQRKRTKAKEDGRKFNCPTEADVLLKCSGTLHGQEACGRSLPVWKFSMQPQNANGRHSMCRECVNRIQKEHKEKKAEVS